MMSHGWKMAFKICRLQHLKTLSSLRHQTATTSSGINLLGCITNTQLQRHYSDGPMPELTSVRYPYVKRGNFSQLESKDVDFFKQLLPGKGRVLTEVDDVSGYNVDWLRMVRGTCPLVLRPKSTKEVSEILRYCHQRVLAVCPQGGNTSLVGGSVPVFDEIVISTQLMNKVISIDEISGVLVCQAGCVLEQLDEAVGEHGLTMPLDLGAKGSCQIGGNVSTNAGGIRLLKYGSLHGSVLGVEAVLANGEIVDCLSSLRKDNTGYDVKQLFIGSEGTLGIVTGVSMLCPSKPQAISVAFLSTDSFPQVLQTLKAAKSQLGEILSAYEFLDSESMQCAEENLKMSNPLSESRFYILLETSGSNGGHDEEKLNNFLESVMNDSLVTNGTIATEPSKVKAIWGLRERLAEALLHDGYNYKYDLSVPLEKFYDLVEESRSRCGDKVTRVIAYGHVGDGNLHLNFTSRQYSQEVHALIEPFVYEWTSKYAGSISAEHGLGFMKRNYIGYTKTPQAVNLMQGIKNVMDPKGILNPYKTLPPFSE